MNQPSTRHRRLAAVLVVAAALAVPSLAAAPSAGAVARTHRHHTNHANHRHATKHGGAAVVREARSKNFGNIVTTTSGQTVYELLSKSGSSLPCSGACPSLWPPVLTRTKVRVLKGLDAKLLGTTKRGRVRQVTYDHHPLYRFKGDTSKGQTNGEGIKSFGGEWFVVGANGKPVRAALTAAKKGSGGSGGGYGAGSSSAGSSSGGSSSGGSSSGGW